MIIDFDAYLAMIDHMREAAPREGVGLLAGPRDRPDPPGGQWQGPAGAIVDRWVPLRNTAEFPRARYETDPDELVDAWQALEDDGRRPWAVVHSHVRTSAAPSDLDVRYAVDPTLLHMIVSLAGSSPVAVLWRLDPNRADPDRVKRMPYQVVDLVIQRVSLIDLTRDVSGRSV